MRIPKWSPSCSLSPLWMDGLGPGAKAAVVQPAPPCPNCGAESKLAGEDSSPSLRRMQTSRLQPPGSPGTASLCGVLAPPAWSDTTAQTGLRVPPPLSCFVPTRCFHGVGLRDPKGGGAGLPGVSHCFPKMKVQVAFYPSGRVYGKALFP